MNSNDEDKEFLRSAVQNVLLRHVVKEFSYYDFSEDASRIIVEEVITIFNRFTKSKRHLKNRGSIDDLPDDCKLPKYVTFQEVRSKFSSPVKSVKRKRVADDENDSRLANLKPE